MRSIPRPAALAAIFAVSALLLPVMPAEASNPPAGLTLTVLPGSATLTASGGGQASFDTGASQVVTGTMPQATVTDVRTLGGGWTVQVSVTLFTHGAEPSVTVSPEAARAYLPGSNLAQVVTNMTSLGTVGATVTQAARASTALPLDQTRVLVAGSTGVGGGIIVYQPTIEVTIPPATPAGTYGAIVTQTLS